MATKTKYKWFVREPETWDAKTCRRKARHTAKDGLETKYPFKGYIGNHYTKTRYNGGIVIEDEWYDGEIVPLPFIVAGFYLFYRSSWGWCIAEIPK